MKRLLPMTLLLATFLTACSSTAAPTAAPVMETESRILTVFAAASLIDAFTEIGKAFEAAHSGVTVAFNFGGSQALRTQIEEGAPADIFASANTREMDALVTGGFVSQNTAQIFLTNRLVVILPANNPAQIETLEDLATPGIKLVLAAEEVPVGKYARQALDRMNGPLGADFKDKVLANVVSNEDNVKQVVAKVQLGEADAGIVYTSDAIAAPEIKTVAIPVEWNVVANYPIAMLAKSANVDLAAKFMELVLSTEGQTTLQKWGFDPIP